MKAQSPLRDSVLCVPPESQHYVLGYAHFVPTGRCDTPADSVTDQFRMIAATELDPAAGLITMTRPIAWSWSAPGARVIQRRRVRARHCWRRTQVD